MKIPRHYDLLDRLCFGIDQVIRTLSHTPQGTGKPYPAENEQETTMTNAEQVEAAALMRINHTGEICAQALYHGQGMVSRSAPISTYFQQAALEEGDHLLWCHRRLVELGSHTSYLNPLWYGGSFCIGIFAGMVGDRWSLGFVAETERQVIKHLEGHLDRLPATDLRSRRILKQMEADEAEHRNHALAQGGIELPPPVRWVMALTSKVMVKTAYWV